jgi:hypothetical protein
MLEVEMKVIKDEYIDDSNVTLITSVVVEEPAPAVDEKILDAKKKDDEDESDDITKFEAIAQEADKKNKNNRIYPKKVLQSALDALRPKLKKKEVFAMSDHPNWMEGPKISRIAAVINEAYLNSDNKVVIKGTFLDNEAANEVKALLKAGVKVGVSARGYGDYDIDEKKKAMIFKEGYEIEGWDFVVYPAANAKVTHFESENTNSKEEITMEIRTLDGLRAAYPELVASLEKPHVDKVAEIVTASDAKVADLTEKLTDAEARVSDLNTKFDELNARHDATLKALDEASGKLTIALDENAKIKADIAAAELKMAIDALLKDCKFAQFIKVPAVASVDEAKAYIDAEVAKFEQFAASLKTDAVAAEPEQIVTEEPKAKAEDMAPAKKDDTDPIVDLYCKLATKQSNKLL